TNERSLEGMPTHPPTPPLFPPPQAVGARATGSAFHAVRTPTECDANAAEHQASAERFPRTLFCGVPACRAIRSRTHPWTARVPRALEPKELDGSACPTRRLPE